MSFALNLDLDLEKITADYALDQRVRINNVLPVPQAIALGECLARHTPYKHAFVQGETFGEASAEQLRALPADQRNQFINSIMQQAASGVGFWYERHKITKTSEGLLGDLYEWLNSEPLLSAMTQITSGPKYKSAIAQATRYQRGDFLTRHQDIVTQERRKIAFVINLPPRWHPDWGGLLQFYQKDGTPRDAWNPDFNSLSLFDVSHIHSVTSISSFAPQARLAVSGWFQLN